jgi:hypothetical protein
MIAQVTNMDNSAIQKFSLDLTKLVMWLRKIY